MKSKFGKAVNNFRLTLLSLLSGYSVNDVFEYF